MELSKTKLNYRTHTGIKLTLTSYLNTDCIHPDLWFVYTTLQTTGIISIQQKQNSTQQNAASFLAPGGEVVMGCLGSFSFRSIR